MHTTHAVVHRAKYPPGCSAHPCPAPLSNQDRAKFASQPELLVSSASQREHNPHLKGQISEEWTTFHSQTE